MTCRSKYCRNKAPKGSNYCYACQKRRYREKNPLRSSFQNLKDNAKRRGKEFSLSFDEFKKFAVKTGYINRKGKSKEGLHIDRIDVNKGYCIDNIQVLTNSDNVKKYWRFEYNPVTLNLEMEYKLIKNSGNIEGCPF